MPRRVSSRIFRNASRGLPQDDSDNDEQFSLEDNNPEEDNERNWHVHEASEDSV